MKTCFALALLLTILSLTVQAQETVFNVPSGDILDRGKVYGELDLTYQHSSDLAGFTPRVVAGIGRSMEAGVNIGGLSTADRQQTTLAPTFKWKAYVGRQGGWAFLVGDTVFIPVQNRSYRAGNYAYAEFTKTWKSGTRLTFGGYHFSSDVVDRAQRAGGQFAFERPLNQRITFATDWFTGAHALGYVSPGVVIKVTPKLTWYVGYQVGNRDASRGNHQFLTEIGWNFN